MNFAPVTAALPASAYLMLVANLLELAQTEEEKAAHACRTALDHDHPPAPPIVFDHPERARPGGYRDHGAVNHRRLRHPPPIPLSGPAERCSR